VKIEIVPVWKALSPELAAELVAFWRDQNAIQNEAAAARRTEQAVCIARDADGALCGVATAVVKVLPRLRQPMYYYRQFFARALRGQHQELAFYRRAKQILQDYNAGLDKPESLASCWKSRTPRSPQPTSARTSPASMPPSSATRRAACSCACPISKTRSCRRQRRWARLPPFPGHAASPAPGLHHPFPAR
jgi:hypothetical protein